MTGIKHKNPIGDVLVLHKDLYNYMLFEEDLDRVNNYRNGIMEFFVNIIIKEGIDITN